MADCCASLVKYLLCLTNFVFFVVGGLVLSIGIWVAADKASFIQMTQLDTFLSSELGEQAQHVLAEFSEPGVLEQAAYLLIAVGSLVFIISFLGYCGALQENRVLLTAYGLFITLVFGLQITGIVMIVIYKGQADDQTRGFLQTSLASYSTDSPRDALSVSWDLVMSSQRCCGVNNSTDFSHAARFQDAVLREARGRKVPEACCILEGARSLLQPAATDCITHPTHVNSYYNKGCYNKFVTCVLDNLNLVFGTIIGLGAFQFLAIAFSFCLCKAAGGRREDYYK